MDDPFVAALLKIERAKHHINDLNREINAYLAKPALKLCVRQIPELAERQLFIETNPPVPSNFSLIAGDAIHNMRAAFDIMIFGLIGDKVAHPDKIGMPVAKSPEAVPSTIASRQIQVAGEEIVNALVSLELHPNGKYGIHTIHELDIRDKHHLILAVGRAATLEVEDLRKIDPAFSNVQGKGAKIKFVPDKPVGTTENPVISHIRLPDPANEIERWKKEANIQPTFDICFGQGQPLANEPMVKALHDLATNCEVAIGIVRAATL